MLFRSMNHKVLGIMPFILLLLISAGSPDYIKPLFSAAGNAVMFVVLVLLTISYLLGRKITDIDV